MAIYDMNNKKLICIEGNGQDPSDMLLFTADPGEKYTDNKIKHLIIQNAKDAENENPDYAFETARIDLTRERALTLWTALWNCNVEGYTFVDVSHTPELRLYIEKPRPNSDRRYLIALELTENQDIKKLKLLARFTLTPQRINRLKNMLTEDW